MHQQDHMSAAMNTMPNSMRWFSQAGLKGYRVGWGWVVRRRRRAVGRRLRPQAEARHVLGCPQVVRLLRLPPALHLHHLLPAAANGTRALNTGTVWVRRPSVGVQAACVEARASWCMELDSLRRVISCTHTAFAKRHTRSRTRRCAREAPLDAAGEAEVADVLR